MLEGRLGRRNHVNGLVYSASQVPTMKKNNNWKYVLRPPSSLKNVTKKSAFQIKTEVGNIFVQYIEAIVPNTIVNAVDYYLANHSIVRHVPGEKGLMVPIGRRVDIRSSALSMYKASRESVLQSTHGSTSYNRLLGDSSEQAKRLNDTSLIFNELLQKSCCKTSLEAELKVLKKKKNTLCVYDKLGKQVDTLPTLAVSLDLTNSIHIDNADDSKSYAIFFRKNINMGLTYFLLPKIGLAIQISGTVIISWDGRVEPHCSCTVIPGIVSLFASSNKFVTTRLRVANGFQNKKKTIVRMKDRVYVQTRLLEMEHKDSTNYDCVQNKKFMNRIAIVVGIKKNYVIVRFVGNLEIELGNVVCSRNDVIRLSDI